MPPRLRSIDTPARLDDRNFEHLDIGKRKLPPRIQRRERVPSRLVASVCRKRQRLAFGIVEIVETDGQTIATMFDTKRWIRIEAKKAFAGLTPPTSPNAAAEFAQALILAVVTASLARSCLN
jgi:hypothetical protein